MSFQLSWWNISMSSLVIVHCFLSYRAEKQFNSLTSKIYNSSPDTSHSARNLGFILDEHLTFSDQITSFSKACCYHIHQLRCILPYFDSSTACTIATSIVHSKHDYCNSLYYKLPKSQLSRLQQMPNSLARIVVKAPSNVISKLIHLPSPASPYSHPATPAPPTRACLNLCAIQILQ